MPMIPKAHTDHSTKISISPTKTSKLLASQMEKHFC